MSDLAYTDSMIDEIRELLLKARQKVTTHINTELLSTYWNVGRIIVEHEQNSSDVPLMANNSFVRFPKNLQKNLAKAFLFPISSLCAGFIRLIKFNRQCLLN